MALKRIFSMTQQNGVGEILIYEEIGESFWGGGISAKRFADDLKALGDLHTINLRINSPGGDVFDGVTIYNQLLNHKARVEVHIDGLAASAASLIAMVGDKITIAESAMIMVHNPWTIAMGDYREMQKVAEMLSKVRDSSVATYAKRTGLDSKAIIKLLDAETWMTGQEAVDQGFADEMSPAKAVESSFKMCAKYKNAPAAILQEKPEESPVDSFDELAAQRSRLELLERAF